MSPELRKRMEKAAEHKHPAHEDGFKEGAEWMHENEVVPRDELLKRTVKYLKHGSGCLLEPCGCGLVDLLNEIYPEKGGEG